MIFLNRKLGRCAFCQADLGDYPLKQGKRIYCNEFCASDEEHFSPQPRRMTLEGLSAVISQPTEKAHLHDP